MPYTLEGDIAKAHPNTLDKSLSLEDAAAEAKATGAAFERAKTESIQYTKNHEENKDNPHKVDKTQVGLGNVDNTSDMNKPVSKEQAAAIQKVSDQIVQVGSKKAEVNSFVGVLAASDWGSEAPFTQEITVEGILEKDEPFVDVDLSGTEDVLSIIEAWGMVGRCRANADDKITAYCYQERPLVDIPLKFKVVR